jgi:two-component system response regulator (stage 0 sporulation protein F)
MTSALGSILIVDDEQPVLEVLSEYFSGQGYDVRTAASGAAALTAVQRARPDLVLLDVRMPGMDGVEVLRRLRATHEGLAVVMVTANEDVALARETLKIGAFDYVAKPFDFAYLDRAVTAGLLQGSAAMPAAPGGTDVWRQLALAVFRAVRSMSSVARASTGDRLEAAALHAAREAAGGGAGATRWLDEIELLLGLATELGDLSATARVAVDAAVGAARKAPAER